MCDICSEGGQILGPYLKPMTHLIHTEYILAGRTIQGRARRAALVDVRGHRHRQPGRERLPADQEVRDQGPRLLRRGDGADRPRRRRRADRGCPDPVAHGRRDGRRPAAGHGGRDAGARLRAGLRGRRDACQGGRHPARVRAGPRADDTARRDRRAGRRRGRARRSSAAATSGSAGSGSTTSPTPSLRRRCRQARGRPRRRGRLHPDAAPRARRARDDEQHRPPSRLCARRVRRVPTSSSSGRARATRATSRTPRSRASARAVDDLLAAGKPFLAVCLGHQVLCGSLGLPLAYKDIVFQGTQTKVGLAARRERRLLQHVRGPRRRPTPAARRASRSQRDPATGDVHLLRGPHYRGVQFHAESILTENGFDLIRELMLGVLSR